MTTWQPAKNIMRLHSNKQMMVNVFACSVWVFAGIYLTPEINIIRPNTTHQIVKYSGAANCFGSAIFFVNLTDYCVCYIRISGPCCRNVSCYVEETIQCLKLFNVLTARFATILAHTKYTMYATLVEI